MAAKLDDVIMITQTDDGSCDYFDDLEEGEKLSLEEGLEIINDAMFDDEDYGLSETELAALNSLLERYVNKEA